MDEKDEAIFRLVAKEAALKSALVTALKRLALAKGSFAHAELTELEESFAHGVKNMTAPEGVPDTVFLLMVEQTLGDLREVFSQVRRDLPTG